MPKTRHILVFDAAAILPLLTHAKACAKHSPTYDQMFDPAFLKEGRRLREDETPAMHDIDLERIPWGLHLVADDGVYLMSNGEPRDIVSGSAGGRSRVCHAQGIDPQRESFDDWWERKVSHMGGDDQVLFLPGEDVEAALARDGASLRVAVWNNGLYVTELAIGVGC